MLGFERLDMFGLFAFVLPILTLAITAFRQISGHE